MTARVPEIPDEPDPWDGSDWNPVDGESIAGEVIGRETVHSKKFDRDFEVLVVENGGGEPVRVACARAHLKALVAEHDPQPGDAVAIVHWDPVEGSSAHRYALRVTKNREEADDAIPFGDD